MNGVVKRENCPDFNDEGWAYIDGFEDYLVHKNGFVMSIKTMDNKRHKTRTVKYRILNMFTVKGYTSVNLIKTTRGVEKRKSARVHRLVAEAFIPKIDGKEHINHKDGNKQNCNIDNLEWCTTSENELHSYRVLNKKNMAGEKRRLFLKEQIIDIRTLANKISQVLIAEKYNCDPSTISNIVNRKTYIGSRWE